jgi:hypothetical protein
MGQGIPTTPIYLSDRSKSEYGYPIRKENINKKIQLNQMSQTLLGLQLSSVLSIFSLHRKTRKLMCVDIAFLFSFLT